MGNGHGDRTAARWVTAGTLALAAAAVGYVLRFGSNVPNTDEWDAVVGPLAADFPWGWVIAHHNEHRYPLGRLVWAAGLRATGFDFRTGMLVTVGLLTATSLLLTDAVRRLRGTARMADLIVPALLLNWGHGFALLMGYQVAFALFGLGLAGVAWTAVRGKPLAGGLFAAVAVQSGGFGLAVTPPLVAWLLIQAWRAARGPGQRWRAAALVGMAVTLVGYSGWVAVTLPPDRAVLARLGAWEFAIAVVQYLQIGLGPRAIPPDPTARLIGGCVAVAVYLAAFTVIGRTIRIRPAAVGLGLVLAGSVLVAGAVAWGRGVALAERFVTPSAAGLTVGWVAVAGLTGWPAGRAGNLVGLVMAGLVVGLSVGPGYRYGMAFRGAVREFERDLRSGVPPVFLAGKHGGAPPFVVGDRVADRIPQLRGRGAVAFALAAADPPLTPIPADGPFPLLLECPLDPFLPGGPPPPKVLIEAPSRTVVGFRLRVEQHHHMGYQLLRLHWKDRATGTDREATAMPLAVPGRGSVAFRLAADPSAVWLEPGCPMLGLTLASAEWLVPAGPPGQQ